MAWRPALSLQTLKSQLDSAYPGWLFLGFLGDQSHAAVASDHNPNSAGVVCALDIGPGGGLDIHALADRLVADPHPDLKYVISNRRIAERQNGFVWQAYNGSDPHDTHIHVSVGRGNDGNSAPPYDDQNNWNVTGEEVMKANDLNLLSQIGWDKQIDGNDNFVKQYTGKSVSDTLNDVEHSVGNRELRRKAREYDKIAPVLADAQNWKGYALNTLLPEIAELKKQASPEVAKRLSTLQKDVQAAIDKSK